MKSKHTPGAKFATVLRKEAKGYMKQGVPTAKIVGKSIAASAGILTRAKKTSKKK